ncbi:ParB-like partition protein [Cylindrospermum stagnale PCC 7417]|uniref:ParB-like partition protein n=1 Tax=Cylindrospermum stagnale PCC 7417 TaxID=56107 RepID=K9X3K6_9NOST|nr:ParB/RepB/Spo0J family partition protein [Cylindrospermum stagnale]AFZ27230.1 ParB-like partition protein [Cylindrospermum stagnale PCC 7417]
MVKKKLGEVPQMKGVEDLLSMSMSPVETTTPSATVPIEKIRVNPRQPRRYFDPDKLAQLVESVKQHGILEPLLVRPLEGGEYELVAGERRLRAATEAQLTEVPIISKDLDDKQARQIALIENLQREDLNPIDETEGILELLATELGIDANEIAPILNQAANAKRRGLELTENVSRQLETIESLLATVGRFTAESFRTSRLPLLNLPDDVLEALRLGKLEYTKARAIAKVKQESDRKYLVNVAISQNLSLSEIKEMIQSLQPKKTPTTSKETLKAKYSDIGKQLKTTQVWENPEKVKKLEKLLTELDQLLN